MPRQYTKKVNRVAAVPVIEQQQPKQPMFPATLPPPDVVEVDAWKTTMLLLCSVCELGALPPTNNFISATMLSHASGIPVPEVEERCKECKIGYIAIAPEALNEEASRYPRFSRNVIDLYDRTKAETALGLYPLPFAPSATTPEL